jgi:Mor family transcriptional regulator
VNIVDIEKWASEIDPNDLPEPYQSLASRCGVKSALVLAELCQGAHVYIPKLDDVMRIIRDRKIKQEYNGYNFRELSLKYGLTEIWIRKIIKGEKEENQVDMFESGLIK